MEKDSFSQRMDNAVSKAQLSQQEAARREAGQSELARQRAAELTQAQERMKQLYIDAARHLEAKGVPTEKGRATLGTNGGGVIGYRQPATEFVTIELPEGWVIGRDTKGQPVEVLTHEGRIFHAAVVNDENRKIGKAVESMPESRTEYAVDENGPFLARLDQYREMPPVNLEDEFMQRIAALLI